MTTAEKMMLTAEQMNEVVQLKKDIHCCSMAMARAMFKESTQAHIGFLSAMRVAAGVAASMGLPKEKAVEAFTIQFDEAGESFMENEK